MYSLENLDDKILAYQINSINLAFFVFFSFKCLVESYFSLMKDDDLINVTHGCFVGVPFIVSRVMFLKDIFVPSLD